MLQNLLRPCCARITGHRPYLGFLLGRHPRQPGALRSMPIAACRSNHQHAHKPKFSQALYRSLLGPHPLQPRRARQHARRVVDMQQRLHTRAPACQARGGRDARAAQHGGDREGALAVLQPVQQPLRDLLLGGAPPPSKVLAKTFQPWFVAASLCFAPPSGPLCKRCAGSALIHYCTVPGLRSN